MEICQLLYFQIREAPAPDHLLGGHNKLKTTSFEWGLESARHDFTINYLEVSQYLVTAYDQQEPFHNAWIFREATCSKDSLRGSAWGVYRKYCQQEYLGRRQINFTLSLKNGKGQKLRRNIKIRRGLVFVNRRFPKHREVIFIMLWPNGNYR